MIEQWQIDQGKRCGCRGTDEYCVCQNVRQLDDGGLPSRFTGTVEQLVNSLGELERSRGLAGAISGAAIKELTRLREENEKLREALGCQATDGAKGEPVSREGALQSGLSAEAKWEPIETAPKDGAPVDLWIVPSGISGTGPGRCPDCWHSNGKWWRYDEAFGDGDCKSEVANATHWMPLPSPPSHQAQIEEPHSGDTDGAAGGEDGLTHKSPSDPQEGTVDGRKDIPG